MNIEKFSLSSSSHLEERAEKNLGESERSAEIKDKIKILWRLHHSD